MTDHFLLDLLMVSTDAVRMVREHANGLDVTAIIRPQATQYFISAHTNQDHDLFRRVASFVASRKAAIAAQFVFGGRQFHEDGIAAIARASGTIAWPVTWIQGDGCSGEHLQGTQVCAVAGLPVEPIVMNGAIVGTVYEDDMAQYCMLGDVRPDDRDASRAAQARAAFDKIHAVLGLVGLSFGHVIRTWMYLSHLLEWYDEFNAVRTQFFTEQGVFEGLVPASTGIGVQNPAGTALVADALAIKPKRGMPMACAVPSPLQCPALAYKSSFSRAVEIGYPDARLLLVSGTASIHPNGESAFVGSTARQIEMTMKVVEAILASRNMTLNDVTRAIAYFKDIRDAPLLTTYCNTHGLPAFSMALSHADICRHDLLFEIEADAFSTSAAPAAC